MALQVPEVLAPISGVLAIGSGLAIVGVYLHGHNLPVEHVVAVEAVVPVSADEAGALLTDLPRRPTWRPHVARIGRVGDAADGRAVWRELDGGDDRLDLVIDEVGADRLVLRIARPEDIGFRATWTWTIARTEGGVRIRVDEVGGVDNTLFRGWWSLRFGPYAAVESDLAAFAGALGAPDAEIVRVR
jgi:hypothetical protein